MVRNHIGIEELGIPVVSIVAEQFVEDVKATGEAFRLQNPAVAITPYAFTSLTAEHVRQAVDDIIDDIIIGLTKPLPAPKESIAQRITTRGPKDEILEFRGKDLLECFRNMNDKCLDWGWSDGFPLIPPTEEAVNDMLEGTDRLPDDIVVEKFIPGNAQATVRKIAINAVMAGCNPEFLPVVITAVEAMHDSDIPTRVMTMSTGPHAPLFIVNGPIIQKLKINSGLCALGPAGPERLSFPNVVIGRAVRLSLMNVGNCYPGIMDEDTIGAPTKFGMVIAENEKMNPWEPYHVEKGFRPEESTVSCCYGQSLTEVCDLESDNAESLMNTIALRIPKESAGFIRYNPVILLCPDHAKILAREGWTKEDIRQYLYLHCRISAEEFRRSACVAWSPMSRKWIEAADSKAMIPLYQKPEDIQIVVVGGKAGKSESYLGLGPVNPHAIKS